MSRTFRFAAALLILASLTCGSLGALPSSSRTIPAESGRSDFLAAIMEWIASVLTPDRPAGEAPQPPPQSKDSSSLDPHGGPH
jgi:hypothetical protein